jgi:GNAT superfamily N-acetyltransferase
LSFTCHYEIPAGKPNPPTVMSSELKIIALPHDVASVRRFLQVSHDLLQGETHWVAPLKADQEKAFSATNPFFAHASMQMFVAHRNGRDVGRIAGIKDDLYNQHQDGDMALFGFYEAENDPAVGKALFEALYDWVRQQGFKRVLGPVNPSTNDECGLLVQGFDQPPAFMMPYNPSYYVEQFQEAGLGKAIDLLAYHIDLNRTPVERLQRLLARFRKRHPEITVRPLRKATFWDDLEKVRQVYNEAWEDNWGFIPMTEKEIDFMASRLKPLLVEGLVWIAETEHEPVGFLLAVPDFNQALKPLKGRLLTPRIFGFLPYLWGWKIPDSARMMVLGVKKSFRLRGVESAMLAEGVQTGLKLGLRSAEASWILENNHPIRRVIEVFGGEVNKIYRLYSRGL